MDNRLYVLNSQAQTFLQAFPLSQSNDSVLITIYDVDDAATDINAVAMTFVKVDGDTTVWSYAWAAASITQNNNYIVTFYNATRDVRYYAYVRVVGSLTGTPGGAGTGSTLSTLRKSLLIEVDRWSTTSGNDLTGDASSGDLATRAINRALQTIYSLIKDSKYMQAYASTGLVSVANQAFIELSGISDLDEIVAMKDATNNVTLRWIPPTQYFMDIPDPSEDTGVPIQYTRIFNRVYLRPRPTAAITYTTEYQKNYADLSADGDTALIPSKYNYWILAEAQVEWFKVEDPYNIPAIILSEREDKRAIGMKDVMAAFGEVLVADSYWGRNELGVKEYDSPIGS